MFGSQDQYFMYREDTRVKRLLRWEDESSRQLKLKVQRVYYTQKVIEECFPWSIINPRY